MADNINPVINQYEIRAGAPYLNPIHIISALPTRGPWGVPYWMSGIAVQTCNEGVFQAPRPDLNGLITFAAGNNISAGQAGVGGAAPTQGIYTGIMGGGQ